MAASTMLSATGGILDKKAGSQNGKSARKRPAQPPIKCPECSSQKIWKDGFRYTNLGPVQRYICRNCGYRFSDPDFQHAFNGSDMFQHVQNVLTKKLKRHAALPNLRQVCVALTRGTKNLAEVEPRTEKWVTGATKQTKDIKGCLVTYAAKQLTMGLKEKTVKNRVSVLELLHRRGADLFNPEIMFKAVNNAKRFDKSSKQLTSEEWSEGTKCLAAEAYIKFCRIFNVLVPPYINFQKWSKRSQKLPWIPLEKEVDQLIAGCSRRTATFLQLLKETGARSGEVWRLGWIDVDMERGIITINAPEKGGTSRQFKVSSKLISMLNRVRHKNSKTIWGNGMLNSFRQNFSTQRRRVASKLQNSRINRITFHTFRHFYGTMEYHRTKDILHVKERLGHRRIESTLVYTHLVNFEGDEYHIKTAKNLKEDEELLKAGFEYVTDRDTIKIYRKRK
jgi:integrase